MPAAAGYNLHPAINLKADGPTDRLALDADVTSEAGNVRGQVTRTSRRPRWRSAAAWIWSGWIWRLC